MAGHHLILGTLTDRLTGRPIEDNHDERYRQKVVAHLLDVCGFLKEEIEAGRRIALCVDRRKASFCVDFIVSIAGHELMVVRYGPGSLVTRHKTAQALCRFLAPHEIPVAVVTNGEAVHLLDGPTGVLVAEGFDAIPSRVEMIEGVAFKPGSMVRSVHRQMAERLLFAYEVDGSCPCDDSICRMDE